MEREGANVKVGETEEEEECGYEQQHTRSRSGSSAVQGNLSAWLDGRM